MSAPILLKETLLFPYLTGATHVMEFKTRMPGGWPFDSLPESTEQVLNADKYFGTRDRPTTVTLPEARTGSIIYENDLGEFETRMYLYEHARDNTMAAHASAGWDGDRFVLLSLGNDREALVWATVWDSAIDQAEFVDALGVTLPRRYRGLKLTTTTDGVRKYQGAGRLIEVRALTIDGRPVVCVVDVPEGASTALMDQSRIRLQQ
jgi:hypothetical protein